NLLIAQSHIISARVRTCLQFVVGKNDNIFYPSNRTSWMYVVAIIDEALPYFFCNSVIFYIDAVRLPLVMKTGGRNRFLGIHAEFDDIQYRLKYRGDNGRSARGTYHHLELSIFFDYRGCHRTQHPLPGFDSVGFASQKTI